MQLTLPYPPSVNHYWRQDRKRGRTYIGKRGVEYRNAVEAELIGNTIRYDGRLKVSICVCPPDRRKRDLDNVCKSLLDAISHAGVWGDDGQIDHLEVVRGDVRQGGCVRVTISEVGPPTPTPARANRGPQGAVTNDEARALLRKMQ